MVIVSYTANTSEFEDLLWIKRCIRSSSPYHICFLFKNDFCSYKRKKKRNIALNLKTLPDCQVKASGSQERHFEQIYVFCTATSSRLLFRSRSWINRHLFHILFWLFTQNFTRDIHVPKKVSPMVPGEPWELSRQTHSRTKHLEKPPLVIRNLVLV